ncbi:MAG TPA: PP2C family serine/threonine-protein phosphatase [Luteimonas sp.]|nr:PP2C family serine/threonine-protein phosphatase [Luteimonas sp.]
MAWRIFAASAKGSSHVAAGLPCQDASAFARHGEWLIAVVCDGAGSAASSHVGSSRISHATVQALTARGELLASADHADIEKLVTDVLTETREALAEHARIARTELSAYAATVVGVVMGPEHGWFFHVGDGIGVARHDDGITLSLPENGEYANETFFLTGHDWLAHLRISPIEKPARSVLLMSDGAMPFVMAKGNQALFAPFVEPVERFLAQADEATGTQALAATLDDPRTHGITSDDKTLLIALGD